MKRTALTLAFMTSLALIGAACDSNRLAVVEGTVRISGTPVADFVVEVGGQATRTGPDGRYRMSGVPTGNQEAIVRRSGNVCRNETVRVVFPSTTYDVSCLPAWSFIGGGSISFEGGGLVDNGP